jgi:dienelactone hydrolase
MTLAGWRAARAGLACTLTLALGGCGLSTSGPQPVPKAAARPAAPAHPAAPTHRIPARTAERAPTGVRTVVVTFVDHRRTVRFLNGTVAQRRLTTVIRYPYWGQEAGQLGNRRVPLIVFAHGFGLTPSRYRQILLAWAQAGYVVAAPVFPGEQAGAPGGPVRDDLLNEPADLRFVVDRLITAAHHSSRGFARTLDPGRIGFAGHSDGGDAVLAVGYDSRFRSARVSAAVVFAGADLPGIEPRHFRAGPPLLAVQGTADPINHPRDTEAYFSRVGQPKLLLTLVQGGHFGPYTGQQPQTQICARVSTAFFDRTLKGASVSFSRLLALGNQDGLSTLR